jgi:hypothetical protein
VPHDCLARLSCGRHGALVGDSGHAQALVHDAVQWQHTSCITARPLPASSCKLPLTQQQPSPSTQGPDHASAINGRCTMQRPGKQTGKRTKDHHSRHASRSHRSPTGVPYAHLRAAALPAAVKRSRGQQQQCQAYAWYVGAMKVERPINAVEPPRIAI